MKFIVVLLLVFLLQDQTSTNRLDQHVADFVVASSPPLVFPSQDHTSIETPFWNPETNSRTIPARLMCRSFWCGCMPALSVSRFHKSCCSFMLVTWGIKANQKLIALLCFRVFIPALMPGFRPRLNGLNARQSEIFTEIPPKDSFKLLDSMFL